MTVTSPQMAYSIARGTYGPVDMPHWDELPSPMRKAFIFAFGAGVNLPRGGLAVDLVTTLRERAASYRDGCPSSEHTASLLDTAAAEVEKLRNDAEELRRRVRDANTFVRAQINADQ
jgi:hypothetical protein